MENITNEVNVDIHWMAMSQSLGRLEGKIDQLLNSQANQKEVLDDHETRIRLLEKGSWRQAGIVVGVSSTVSVVLSYLMKSGLF